MVNVEAALASAMSRLEAKLDLMLADAWVRPRIPSQPRGPGEEDLASFEKELERRKTARKVHHNDGFRRMYMMEPTRTKEAWLPSEAFSSIVLNSKRTRLRNLFSGFAVSDHSCLRTRITLTEEVARDCRTERRESHRR